MKKMYMAILATGLTLGFDTTVSAGLVDGGFEAAGSLGTTPVSTVTNVGADKANALYHQTDIDPSGVSTLDQGWYSGNAARISQQGAGDKYCQFGSTARWDAADRFWAGQLYSDAEVTGNQTVSFDIVAASFAEGDASQRLIVEVLAMTTTNALNSRISLVDAVAVGFTSLGSQQVDISSGVGSYSTTNIDFTSTATIYGIRMTTFSTNGTAAITGPLGIDNIFVSTNIPPPPPEADRSFNLVDGGFEAVGALGATPSGNSTQADSLYNQTAPGGATTLDMGWYSGSTGNITQQGSTDKYAQFGTGAGWNKDDRYWIGQMFTATNATGEYTISFDIEVDDYVDANNQTLVVSVYTVPEPTPENAKLKLNDDISSFALLGSQTVDISRGNGSYETGIIDFTATSDLYALAIQVYSKDGSDVLQNVSGVMGLDNVAINTYSDLPPTNATASIVSITPVSGTVLELVVSTDNPGISYPKSRTSLTTGSWGSADHSISPAGPFVTTNLEYSVAAGTNYLIYVEADTAAKFFDIGVQ